MPPAVAAAPPASTSESVDPGLARRFFNLRTLLSFLVGFGLLALLFSRVDVDVGRIVASITQTNPWLVIAALVVYYLTFPARGARWRLMLRNAGIDQPPGVVRLGTIIFLSWFANCLLPAKLGDVYRAYLLRRHSGISLSRAGGTVVAERLIDFGFVLILIGASALLIFRGRVPDSLVPFLELGGAAVLLAGLALLVLRRWERLIPRFLPSRFHSIYERFHEGAIGSFGRYPSLALLTLLGWLAEVGRFALIAQALGLDLGASPLRFIASATFVALGSAIFTSAAPTPGGLGAAELAIVAALALLGQSGELALAAALLDRLISYWSLVIVGVVVYVGWESRQPSFRAPAVTPVPASADTDARRD